MASVSVSNTPLTAIPVKVTEDAGANVQHVNVDNVTGSISAVPTAPAAPTATVMFNAQATSGVNSTALDVGGYANAVIVITGLDAMETGTLDFYASADGGSTYQRINATYIDYYSGAPAWVSGYQVTPNGPVTLYFSTAGLTHLRLYLSYLGANPVTAKGYPAVFAGNIPSTGTSHYITNGTYLAEVTSANELKVRVGYSYLTTLTNVSASVTSVTIKATNYNRKVLNVFNDSTAWMYLKFGTSASTTSFTVKIAPGQYYEMPQPVYVEELTAVWASATGTARVTEGV